MTLEQAILDAVRELPPDKQQELLDHAKHLRGQAKQPRTPLKSGRGLWADLNIDLSAEEIDEARREAWKNFLRDDYLSIIRKGGAEPMTLPRFGLPYSGLPAAKPASIAWKAG